MIYINKKDKAEIKEAFHKIKEEMTDHLQSINENTNEIKGNHDYISHVESMINKLSERLDELDLKISELNNEKIMKAEDFKDIVLTPREQEIFVLLYSRTGDLIDYREISKSLGITETSARKYVSSIINKGIPVIKKYFDSKVYLILDADFRNLQARLNIIKTN